MDFVKIDTQQLLAALFIACQILYTLTFLVEAYFFSRPVNWVDMKEVKDLKAGDYPYIVLFYPVLRELEETMRTTFFALSKLDYPIDRYRVVAIPNENDVETVASLRRLQSEFAFLEMIEVPPTTDDRWEVVWNAWEVNEKVYWWHQGVRAKIKNLPPKKTRQLIYAFYQTADESCEDFLVNYIDADSCPPPDHFLAAAVGMKHYDVLQSQNIAGNLNTTMASTWHSFDHMAWDGLKYPHLSADGHHPYWVLGKGLFFRASDLVALGGFHPWITIEDPEVGMRFWVNGKRLGIIQNPLIEEVPLTLGHGITQRKRWVCGFFQSLSEPLTRLGMTPFQKFKAWLNFLPCLSFWINSIGFPIGVWALWHYFNDTGILPAWTVWHSALNVCLFAIAISCLYYQTWKRTAIVLDRLGARVWYMVRINPISIMIWWIIWLIPLWIGLKMFLSDGGLVWQRTEKVDANSDLVRSQVRGSGQSS